MVAADALRTEARCSADALQAMLTAKAGALAPSGRVASAAAGVSLNVPAFITP